MCPLKRICEVLFSEDVSLTLDSAGGLYLSKTDNVAR